MSKPAPPIVTPSKYYIWYILSIYNTDSLDPTNICTLSECLKEAHIISNDKLITAVKGGKEEENIHGLCVCVCEEREKDGKILLAIECRHRQKS